MKKMKPLLTVIAIIAIAGFGFLYLKKDKTNSPTSQDASRQRDVTAIKNFSGNQNAAVEFVEASKSSNGEVVPVNVYYSGADQYEVDANGKIVEFRSRDLPIGNENEKVLDYTARYNQQEMEVIARQLIAKDAPEADLEKLTLTQNSKESGKTKNYFFRWEDRTKQTSEGYPYIQVSYSQGGTLIGYINVLGL